MKVPKCAHCDDVIGDELVALSRNAPDQNVQLAFCSVDCMAEYLGLVPRAESDQEVKREAFEIHRRVCPACRRRIQGWLG